MFCNQCQETAKNTGCTIKGVCGKSAKTALLQDLLIYSVQGLAYTNQAARGTQIDTTNQSRHIIESLFMTITNANFDDALILAAIQESLDMRDDLKTAVTLAEDNDCTSWTAESLEDLLLKAESIGVLSYDSDPDMRSLKQYILYGIKGVAAYADHAAILGYVDNDVIEFIEDSLVIINQPTSLDELLAWVVKTGENGVKVMQLLDTANTTTYGNPEISQVNLGVGQKPGILISGHDLKDLEQLLIQSADSGVDIYTHSEMLPAHAYPAFKKYDNLVGNYGGAWHNQLNDFETFNGPILFTTNCLVPPKSSSTYNDRVFVTGVTGMPGWKKVNKILPNGEKDFSEIIAMAKTTKPPTTIESGQLTIGFAHNQVLQLADKILAAVNSGAITKLVVMSGCDARQKSREYYTEFAKKLDKSTVILTSGCAKYRYNKLDLGDIGGIPRVLDAGQCNDSYSWAVVALKLKEVLGLDDINQLPLFFNIAWYEQKAVIVHLALLFLGIKNTHIGPTLPAWLTPNVLKVVQDKFAVGTITTVEEDLKLL